MDRMLGLVRVKVVRGVNLAYRDARGSDPYVVIRCGHQKLKTSVKKSNVNPEWNEELTLAVSLPLCPIIIQVFDKDTFSRDDEMGDAEFSIEPLVEATKMDLDDFLEGMVICTVQPADNNCFARESPILWRNGRVAQDIILRLRNVESGEIELQLQWINIF